MPNKKTSTKPLTANQLNKHKSVSIPDLIAKATRHFNKFIRERDKNKGCISCGGPVENAGHYYSAGQYPPLRFNENNVHGQCIRCNKWLHGNLIHYGQNLVTRIGPVELHKLNQIVSDYKRNGYKWDRFTLIEIITKYQG